LLVTDCIALYQASLTGLRITEMRTLVDESLDMRVSCLFRLQSSMVQEIVC